MAARRELAARVAGGGNYFAGPVEGVEFFSTGCTLLDLALGGGWAEGRIINIVGDRSSGKTLLCIEASANFARKHPNGRILYREAEAAFDERYAAALGMPLDRVEFGDAPLETVEDLFEELTVLAPATREAGSTPVLYIVDSLDALSDRTELARPIDAGTFGTSKARKSSEMFRRLVRLLHKNVTLIIVNQVRDNIGVAFGDSYTRAGGRALDFYASQRLDLAQVGVVTRERNKIKRAVGIDIRGRVKKNKVALPMREAQFPIIFGYGVDDAAASKKWLRDHKFEEEENLQACVRQRWYEVEASFLPQRRKYE